MTRADSAVQDESATAATGCFAHNGNPHPYSAKLITQTLDALAIHTQTNPDHLLTLPDFPRIALEAPTASGGKFWVGSAMETGISIRWGKIGTAGTVKHIPISQCNQKNPVLELKSRTLSKLAKGYGIMPNETRLP